MSEQVTISKSELDALRADKARLDYLDECNRRLNAKSGTLYGWRLVQSHNVNRLMLNFPNGVDLHDSQAVGCHPTGHLSVRDAIDGAACYRITSDANSDQLVAESLREWAVLWRLDGDVVYCRLCNRGICYSRRGEALNHSADCKTKMAYPWELLTALCGPISEELRTA